MLLCHDFIINLWKSVIVVIFWQQGALTHGDRRATESRDLSRFNIDNRFGSQALQSVMKSILESTPMAPLPDAYTNEVKFFKGMMVGSNKVAAMLLL